MTPGALNNGKEPGGLSNMIFLSLVIHLAVLTIVFVSLPTSSRHLTFGPVYSVQLVSSEMVLAKKQESSLMKEIEKGNTAAGSVIYKRQVTGIASTPVKKEEVNRSNIEKALSAIKQKQIDEPAPAVATSAKPNPAVSAARTQQSEFNSWLQEYSARTQLRIKKNFSIPPGLMPKENIETIIAIKILRDGTLDYSGFEKKSGNRYFDDAALKAIKKSTPFPAFPEGIKENSVEIGIMFHPSQLR